ncbi:hypothetical protein BB559_002376 [Furculomyces boomerangus]|uniref:Uncharacterized protein n=1 Tax=Furculomyces boomerangus TaxID=61424 RepID=A0A2T9YW34_9FUNG|nr:hypothetical protein BB559_002376 [Furculomyces boomerangus]
MDERREELEKKRAKLAELRRAREERRQALMQSRLPSAEDTNNKKNLSTFVESLIGPKNPISSSDQNVKNSVDSSLPNHSPQLISDKIHPLSDEYDISDTNLERSNNSSSSPKMINTNKSEGHRSKILDSSPNLTSFATIIFDIPPKEKVFYSKEIQVSTELDDDEILDIQRKKDMVTQDELHDIVDLAIKKEIDARNLEEKRKIEQELLNKAMKEKIEFIDKDTKMNIKNSEAFLEFFYESSKYMERAIDEDYDFMVNYSLKVEDESTKLQSHKLRHLRNLYSEGICHNRSVTDVCWSEKFDELIATSYNRNALALNEPDGIVGIWNIHLQDRPEFVFHSPSDVLRVLFNEFDPTMIIGSTYSGQIMIWDTRTKLFPVMKTLVGASGHTQPVYSLNLVGTKNAHQLVTASTDGQVCTWQLDMLAQPFETINLVNQFDKRVDDVGVTCMDFADNETSSFWVGTQGGEVFTGNRYDGAGSKAGLVGSDLYNGHEAAISGLNVHPLFGPIDFTDIVATSSFDYTCKIWRSKSVLRASNPGLINTYKSEPGQISSGMKGENFNTIMPICSLDVFDDFVYDTKWSPSHPGILATGDGSGNLSIFNFNLDTQIPITVERIKDEAAINKLSFSKNGKHIAAGASNGVTSVYELGDFGVPKPDDFSQFSRTIGNMCHRSS